MADLVSKSDESQKINAKPSFYRQVAASMAIYFLSISIGAGAGFSGVAIIQVSSAEEGFAMTEEQSSWFASLQTFAMIPTCLLGGFLGEWLGRRMTCMLMAPLFILGNICIAASSGIQLLYFGRLLVGSAAGLLSGPAGVYVSEIGTPDWRTAFGAGLSTFYMVGTFIIYTLGKWLHWRTLAGISTIFPLFSIISLYFVPESPSWLVTQGRLVESKKALKWLRGDRWDVSGEMSQLERSYTITQAGRTKVEAEGLAGNLRDFLFVLKQLKRPDVWKPFLIISSIMLLQQFSGISTITYYAVSIMEKSGSSIDKYTATIIFGLVRLASCFLGSWLLSKLSRRLLLIVSAIFVSFGMSLLGTSVYLTQDKEEDGTVSGFIGFLPLIAANIVALAYQSGLGPIPWSYCSELYPVDLRARLSGISNCIANIYIFLTIKSFPAVQSAFTPHGAYWFYSAVGLAAALFGATLLPDTRGKTLAEVTEYFTTGCCVIRPKDPGQNPKNNDTANGDEMSVKNAANGDALSVKDTANGDVLSVTDTANGDTLPLQNCDKMLTDSEGVEGKKLSPPIVRIEELDELLPAVKQEK